MMIYVILGETASGKSAVALSICRRCHLPLLSADAFAVYRGFDIGSAKPTPEELSGIESHFISSRDFGDEMTAYDFQKEGRRLLDGFKDKGQDSVIAGGTFLYVRALLFPYEFPAYDEEEKKYDYDIPLPQMRGELLRLDPQAGSYVDLSNPRRVERALALAKAGVKRSSLAQSFVNRPLYPTVFIRIKATPAEIRRRIDQRVDRQVEEGLFEETKRLTGQNPLFASKFRGIGFKEVYEGLKSENSPGEIAERIKYDTHRYAKRQRTFLRHQFPYMVELERDRIVDLVCMDLERRKHMADEVSDRFSSLLPVVPVLAREYLPWIDSLYRQGVRQIAVFTLDEALKKNFADYVHLHSPLMQVLYFDQHDFDDPKLPPLSFVLPLLNDLKMDPFLEDFIKERHLEVGLPKGLDLNK